MSAPYSLELRQRVVAAVDTGKESQAQVAARFGVSLGWIEGLLRQRRRLGHIAFLGHGGGYPHRVTPRAVEVIRAVVTAQPDVTLARLREAVQTQTGVQVGTTALWRWIKDLGLQRLRKSTAKQMKAPAKYLDKAQHRKAARNRVPADKTPPSA